jgi:hypothetical protein
MKINSIWLGLFIGCIMPIISLAFFYTFSFRSLSFSDFYMMITKMDILTQTLTICVLPSFFVFFFFYWKQYNKSAQGVVLATLLLTIITVIFNI